MPGTGVPVPDRPQGRAVGIIKMSALSRRRQERGASTEDMSNLTCHQLDTLPAKSPAMGRPDVNCLAIRSRSGGVGLGILHNAKGARYSQVP